MTKKRYAIRMRKSSWLAADPEFIDGIPFVWLGKADRLVFSSRVTAKAWLAMVHSFCTVPARLVAIRAKEAE